MKNMKKKGLVLGVLSVLCLSGVGFASWVVSQDTEEKANGNISAEAVVDNSLSKPTLTWVKDSSGTALSGAASIHFGYTQENGDTWLTHDSDAQPARLSAFLEIKFKKGEAAKLATTDAINITVAERAAGGGYTQTLSTYADYITMPEAVKLQSSDFTTKGENDVAIAEIVFDWGTIFGAKGTSPEGYVSTHTSASGESGHAASEFTELAEGNLTNAEFMAKVLEVYETKVSKIEFTATVTATAKTTNA